MITTYLDPTPWKAGCPAGCDACYDGTCTFICTSGVPCPNKIMDCPDGWACEAICDGTNACSNATVDCTGAAECHVDCVDANACLAAKVNCGVGDCDMYCDGLDSCKNTTLKVTGAGDATMTCNALSVGEACTDLGAGTCTKAGC